MRSFKQGSKILMLFIVGIIVYLFITGPRNVELEHESLLLIFNTLFTGLIPIIIAFIAVRTCIRNSLLNALFLSCGMLAFGLGSISTGVLRFIPNSTNIAVTVYNICAFIGAACHLVSAAQEDRIGPLLRYKKSIRLKLALSLGAVCLAVFAVIYGTIKGGIPPFVDSSGFTNLRYAVMWIAIAFHFAAGMFYSKQYQKNNYNEHFWYAQSLFMISLGLFGVCVAPGVGTPLGWAGRLAQYIGAGFAFISILEMHKKARHASTTVADVMADFFSDAEASYRNLIEASPDSILSIDHDFRIFIANTSARTLFAMSHNSIMKKSFLDLLDQPYRDEVMSDFDVYGRTGQSALIGLTKEMVARDGAGRIFPVEISFAGQRINAKYAVSLIIRDISERERTKTTERIKVSLEEAQRIAHIGSWEWHIGSDQLYWSKEMFRILGLDPETATARKNLYFEQMVPEDKEKVSQARDGAVMMGDSFDVEFRIVNPDGRLKYIHSVATTYCGQDGQAIMMRGSLQDITERRLAEKEVKRNAEFEKTILHLAQNFINISSEQAQDAMTHALKAIGEYAGADRVTIYRYDWDKGYALHQYEWDKVPENYARDRFSKIPFDKLEAVIELNRKGQAFYQKSSNDKHQSKFDEVTKESGCNTGIVYPIMISNQLYGTIGLACFSDLLRHDINNSVIQVYSQMIANVLQRIEAHRSLQEISEINRLILDSTSDGIAMYDIDGNIISMNTAFMNRPGVPQDVLGKNIRDIMPVEIYGDLAEQRFKKLRQVFETGKPLFFEDERDGIFFWNRFYPVLKDGSVAAVSLFSTNITDTKRVEKEARRAADLQLEAEILRKKEKEYLEILDGSTEASWIYDFEDGTLKYSDEWKKRIGAEHVLDDDMNLYAMTLVHPDDVEKITRDKKATYEAKLTKYKNEYRFKINTGEYIWVYDQGKVVYNESGDPIKIYGTSMDISDRTRAEEAVKESETLMRTIMDSAADFMFVKDTQSRIIMVNQAYGKTFGIDIHDVIGKNDYELYPDPDMARGVIENDQYVIRTGGTLICEESAMTQSGYRTYLLSKVPWRDAKGSIIGVLGVSHDITELKNAQNFLHKSLASIKYQKEYINILYETTGGILTSLTPRADIANLCSKVMTFLDCDAFFNYLLEENEMVMRLNACEGITDQQKQDMEFLALGVAVCGCAVRDGCRIIANSIQTIEDPRTELVKSLGIRAYACHPLMVNGKAIGSLSFGTRSRDSYNDEELLLMKTVAKSISVALGRKQNEEMLIKQAEELRVADQNKNEFLGALSHELRNPLASIVAGLSLLDISKNKEQQEKAKEIMKRQTKQLSNLVDDLLDITRITRNKIELKKEMLELNRIAASVADDHKTLFDDKKIKLEKDIKEDPIYIDADPVRIKQIIGNLLHNALKFTNSGGGVTLSVYAEQDEAVIHVKDCGKGIDPMFLPDLFEPFKQADKSLDRQNGGLGLGLSIVKGIAELHGGSVQAYSEGPGKGSKFSIYIPIAG